MCHNRNQVLHRSVKFINHIIKQDLQILLKYILVIQSIYDLRLKIFQKAKQNPGYFQLLKLAKNIIKGEHIDYLLINTRSSYR